MASKGGMSTRQFEKWVKLGRPSKFKYYGKTVEPMEGLFDGLMQRGGSSQLVRIPTTPDQLEKVRERIESAQEKREQELKSLKVKALALWKKDESNAQELGDVLWKIKSMLPHGDFQKWWKKEALSQARVSYCMRLASPEGDKVKAAKEKVKRSPRAKALTTITKKLRDLYDTAEAGNQQRARELLKQIVDEIEQRFFKKPVEAAKAAAVGAA